MKRLILGTAGHVDHGKTALVRALTGIECDTHREEKSRGITINLGFAHLDLGEELSFGIVDVPGHRDFVHTMVGGASGIDLAMLVVAADSGVMPQTREHLEIMDVLGIASGVVVITKVDLADDDIIDLAEEEIRETLEGTFLEGCPVVRVSSISGDGIDVLKKELAAAADALEERAATGVFRLFPDRFFTVSGFGAVVTGSVQSGTVAAGDTTYLLPAGKKLRVRRMERHGQEVEQVSAGDRASLNLVGLDREDFSRGMVLSDRSLDATTMLDARLRLFPQVPGGFGLWTQVVFHLGTYEQQARIHLMDTDHLNGGETALAQIHLDQPCVTQHGDRFVIRNSSSDYTLGGGEVIDPAPLHHRRRTEKVVLQLDKLARGKLPELIAAELKKLVRPASDMEIADILHLTREEVAGAVTEGPEEIVSFPTEDGLFLCTTEEKERLEGGVATILTEHHRAHPLDARGRTAEEMMGTLGLKRGSSGERVLRLLLADLEARGVTRQEGKTHVLASHGVEISEKQQAVIDLVEAFLERSGMSVPQLPELFESVAGDGVSEGDARQFLAYLVDRGKAYQVDQDFLHASHVDRARKLLVEALLKQPDGLSVADFRDLVQGNRRICLMMVSIFDSEGITARVGDVRVLTRKGKELSEG